MKNQIVSQVRSLVLFVICMLGLGALNRVEAEQVVSHTFRVQKLPRTTSPQEMQRAGYVRVSVAEGGWDNTQFYNYVGKGRAKIMIFPAEARLWCVKDRHGNYTPVYRDICFNPIEEIPRQEVVEQQCQPERPSLRQYVEEGLQAVCGILAAGVNGMQCIQQSYPQYYQPCYQASYMPQPVRECVMPPQQVSNTTINIVTNTTYTKNVWVNQHCATAPPSTYCPPLVGPVIPSSTRNGAVAYNGATGNQIPRNANGDATVPVSLPGDPGYVAPGGNGRQSSQQLVASAAAPANVVARSSAKVASAPIASATAVPATRKAVTPAAPLAANARLTTTGVSGRMTVPKAATIAANKAQTAPVPIARQASIPRASAVIPPASKVAQAAAVRSSVPRGNAVVPAAKVRSMIPPASMVAKQFQSASPSRNPYGSSVPRVSGSSFVPQARNSIPLASNYRSPVSNYRAPVNNYRAPVSNFRAPAPSYSAPRSYSAPARQSYSAPRVNYSAPVSYGRRR